MSGLSEEDPLNPIPKGTQLPTVPDCPEIHPKLAPFWVAFTQLSRARPWLAPGMGSAQPLPIPASEILSECQIKGMIDIEFAARVVRELDDIFLDDWFQNHKPKDK